MKTPTQDPTFHALHHASLGGDGITMEPAWALALQASFGSVERWRAAFIAMGRAHSGAGGWLLLSFQPRAGKLVNQWTADPAQVPAGGVPLLALEVREPAAAAACVEAYVSQIAWAAACARYQTAVNAASEPFGAEQDDVAARLVLDVRRAGAYAKSPQLIAGAQWRDPATVAQWAGELETGREVVVYCVHGHEVSRAAALQLRAAGIDARFLRGGIDAWKAAGLPLNEPPPG